MHVIIWMVLAKGLTMIPHDDQNGDSQTELLLGRQNQGELRF
jgi:hypothetical protein